MITRTDFDMFPMGNNRLSSRIMVKSVIPPFLSFVG